MMEGNRRERTDDEFPNRSHEKKSNGKENGEQRYLIASESNRKEKKEENEHCKCKCYPKGMIKKTRNMGKREVKGSGIKNGG